MIGMNTILQKTGFLILTVLLVSFMLPVRVWASFEIPGTCQVQTDSGAADTVKTLDYSYAHNTYLSLRDMAMVLKDTEKSFSLEITQNSVSLTTEAVYTPTGTENSSWESDENPDIPLRRNEFQINGQKAVYHTLITRLPSGDYDCFMMTTDLAMLLDVTIISSEEGLLWVDTKEPFYASPADLEDAGYFYGVNGVLVGDATTGDVFFAYQSDEPYPIASTSKLMTCLLTMEAISSGQITPSQSVIISDAVERLAASSDGVIPLKAGDEITIQELMTGLLLPSSNECALCLAQTIAGSEEAFVQMMNHKAGELGLSQAVFYNSHGLPSYTEDPISSKRQNRMSAEDMFRLSSYLLEVYPQVTEITSMKETTLESLDFKVQNGNPLLYNMSQVTGLKTGTTNKAGACLVTSLTVEDEGQMHDLVVVVLGSEDSMERGRISGLLARYAIQAFYEGPEIDRESLENLPVNAQAAVDRIIRDAMKR